MPVHCTVAYRKRDMVKGVLMRLTGMGPVASFIVHIFWIAGLMVFFNQLDQEHWQAAIVIGIILVTAAAFMAIKVVKHVARVLDDPDRIIKSSGDI
jgi:hypothetical protein